MQSGWAGEGSASVRQRIALLLATVVLAGQMAGCRSGPAEERRGGDAIPHALPQGRHPIVLVGLDGLEWKLVLELVRQGRLPALAGLMRRGTFGRLETLTPTWSPVIWTSIATGKVPAKHGISGFVHSPDADGWRRLYTSADRKTKAVWNILTDFGRRVITVGWWMTFPVEATNGVMVAQVNTTTPESQRAGDGIWKGGLVERLDGQVHPPDRQAEILSIVRETESELPELTRRVLGDLAETLGPLPRRLWANCAWALRADAIYHRIGRTLLTEEPAFDLFAIYFGGSDVVSHRFWRYTYPQLYERQPTDREVEELGDVLQNYYGYLDGIVGDLIEAAPADAIVMVVSDHGMVPANTTGRFAAGDPANAVNSAAHPDAPPGVFMVAGPTIRGRQSEARIEDVVPEDLGSVGSVLDITPTILALLGVPIGRDMDGRVLRELFDPRLLAEHPVRSVASHEPWLRLPAGWFMPDSNGGEPDAAVLERLEQLRALGYIE